MNGHISNIDGTNLDIENSIGLFKKIPRWDASLAPEKDWSHVSVPEELKNVDTKGNCICQIPKSEAISINISEFNLASGYYYLVDVKELKLIRLCPIPSSPLREEP